MTPVHVSGCIPDALVTFVDAELLRQTRALHRIAAQRRLDWSDVSGSLYVHHVQQAFGCTAITARRYLYCLLDTFPTTYYRKPGRLLRIGWCAPERHIALRDW